MSLKEKEIIVWIFTTRKWLGQRTSWIIILRNFYSKLKSIHAEYLKLIQYCKPIIFQSKIYPKKKENVLVRGMALDSDIIRGMNCIILKNWPLNKEDLKNNWIVTGIMII